jgi:hypothetical protein
MPDLEFHPQIKDADLKSPAKNKVSLSRHALHVEESYLNKFSFDVLYQQKMAI